MGVNKVILLGRLGKDPELRYTQQQTPVCSFSLATGDRRKDQSGQWVEHTEWHNIVAWGKTAETCSNFLKKGREVYIEGRLQTRKWQDKDGRDRYTTEIVAGTVQFVGGKNSGLGDQVESSGDGSRYEDSGSSQSVLDSLPSADALASKTASADLSFEDDDIPF